MSKEQQSTEAQRDKATRRRRWQRTGDRAGVAARGIAAKKARSAAGDERGPRREGNDGLGESNRRPDTQG